MAGGTPNSVGRFRTVLILVAGEASAYAGLELETPAVSTTNLLKWGQPSRNKMISLYGYTCHVQKSTAPSRSGVLPGFAHDQGQAGDRLYQAYSRDHNQ